MNLTSVLSSLGSLSTQIAGLIVPGADRLPQLIEAGKATIEAFKNLKAANGDEAPASAEEGHRALVDAVNQHAEATFGRAEGGE